MAQRSKKPQRHQPQRLQRWFQAAASTCYMMVLFAQPAAAADTIWSRFSTIMADVYGERAVSEATSWLKRIIVTWIVLNTLGFAVAYLQPLIQGGQYTP